jgi:hypothetical protein
MSAPGGGAPSPAPRSGSIGPNAPMSVPQQPLAANPPVVHTPTTPGPSAPPTPVSQQNLNQIVSCTFFLAIRHLPEGIVSLIWQDYPVHGVRNKEETSLDGTLREAFNPFLTPGSDSFPSEAKTTYHVRYTSEKLPNLGV